MKFLDMSGCPCCGCPSVLELTYTDVVLQSCPSPCMFRTLCAPNPIASVGSMQWTDLDVGIVDTTFYVPWDHDVVIGGDNFCVYVLEGNDGVIATLTRYTETTAPGCSTFDTDIEFDDYQIAVVLHEPSMKVEFIQFFLYGQVCVFIPPSTRLTRTGVLVHQFDAGLVAANRKTFGQQCPNNLNSCNMVPGDTDLVDPGDDGYGVVERA